MSSTYTTLSANSSTEKAILKVYRIFLITEQRLDSVTDRSLTSCSIPA